MTSHPPLCLVRRDVIGEMHETADYLDTPRPDDATCRQALDDDLRAVQAARMPADRLRLTVEVVAEGVSNGIAIDWRAIADDWRDHAFRLEDWCVAMEAPPPD